MDQGGRRVEGGGRSKGGREGGREGESRMYLYCAVLCVNCCFVCVLLVLCVDLHHTHYLHPATFNRSYQ